MQTQVKLMDGARKLCYHMTAVSLLWVLTCAEYRQHAHIAILPVHNCLMPY